MPVAPTYPGVYIEEVPSGVRTITGVATSIAAFVGYFSRGPMNEAVRIFNPGDFEREFGGLHRDSEAAYAIDQFFLNGGTQAWVVRTAAGNPEKAAVQLEKADSTPVLQIDAVSEGVWGDNVRIDVDYGTATPDATFNLTVREVVGGEAVATEVFRNLTMNSGEVMSVVEVVEGGSRLVRVTRPTNAANEGRPVQTGTTSNQLNTAAYSALVVDDKRSLTATIGAISGAAVSLETKPTTFAAFASGLQSAIRASHATAFRNVTVKVVGSLGTGAYLQIQSGTADADDVITFADNLAVDLGLDQAGNQNVQHYALGGGAAAFQNGADNNAAQEGDDGTLPGGQELQDALPAFDKVDLFNILCLPDTMRLPSAQAVAAAEEATRYCERRRAFYILDVPHPVGNPIDTVAEMEGWLDQHSTLRNKNVATYFPRPRVADPLNDFRLRPIAPSGTIAGLYARTDANRGVWKAPAGTEANLRGVQAFEYLLTDEENGILNPLGINCLRNFRIPGRVCWGARTLDGADQLASEWKYVPVRRLALFLEESLYRGTQWVVFEPNDEPLWAQIRLNLGAFMHGLFRQGAFQGTKPRDAYLVKCDKETTTQDDVNRGIVNIVVGFAPLKPAEFVIIKIQQLAGQVQA